MTEIELRNLSRVDRLFPELNLLCCVRLRLLSAYKYCPDRTKTSTSGRMCPYRCRTVRFGHKSRAKMAEFACSNSEDVLHGPDIHKFAMAQRRDLLLVLSFCATHCPMKRPSRLAGSSNQLPRRSPQRATRLRPKEYGARGQSKLSVAFTALRGA